MDFSKIAIIGAGPAGCICAYYASESADVTLFDFSEPLHTLLCTGGGRCNLAFSEYDFKELSKFYPRGEKFLYSIFSKFSTANTIEFFESIGVKTYVQDDYRIFPDSNNAKEVRYKMLEAIKKCQIRKEKVVNIIKDKNKFFIKTNSNNYYFDKVIISIGGHSEFKLAKNLGHNIVEPRPALTGLVTAEKFKLISGVSIKNIEAQIFYEGKKIASIQDDILFTHEGISGPLTYKISSIFARIGYSRENPLLIQLNLLSEEIDLQQLLNSNPKKSIKNLVSEFVPKTLAEYILTSNEIRPELKCCDITGKVRDLIFRNLENFKINAISPAKEGEVVTSGGVSLDEINSADMQSKIVENLYFCGEVINVDGFCGGFNLQNCWSTGFVAGTHCVIN